MSPAEPTSQPDDPTSLATIKQLTVISRGPGPQPNANTDDAGEVATWPAPADRAPDNTHRSKARQIEWASIRPEVLQSCSVALRRMGDSSIGSIAVTSTSRGEGRTTVALGLAATASLELRRKTILLDLDLEHGAIEKMTAVGPGPGVVEFLYEEASIEDCLQPVDSDVDIVRAGLLRDRGGVATRIERLADLIQQLGDRCDVMVADLPPMSSGVTAARIADLFESVTLVVRAGGVTVPDIEQTASVLSQRPFVILNGTAAPRSSWVHRILGGRP
jgi:Mrp family chromosome partitioning ATPase